MPTLAAFVLALGAFAVGEGIIALRIDPPTESTIIAALLGIGMGSGVCVVATSWWIWGHPPYLLPLDIWDRIYCFWNESGNICRMAMGPPKWWD